MTQNKLKAEPYGYFRVQPFGWEDCAENDEGAFALYEHPDRVPLTDAALDAMRQADNGQLNFVSLRAFRIIARAVERAHGIHPSAHDTP